MEKRGRDTGYYVKNKEKEKKEEINKNRKFYITNGTN